jgi:hypothetical protein
MVEQHIATLYRLAGISPSIPPGPAKLIDSLGGTVRFATLPAGALAEPVMRRSSDHARWTLVVPWDLPLQAFTWTAARGLARWYAECFRVNEPVADIASAVVMPAAALHLAVGQHGCDTAELAHIFCVDPAIVQARLRAVFVGGLVAVDPGRSGSQRHAS